MIVAVMPRRAIEKNKHRRPSVWQLNVGDIIFRRSQRRMPLRETAVFCRKAAFLFDTGLTVKASMPILAGQARSSYMSKVLGDVHKYVAQGESFSRALRETGSFPAFMCGYVDIGEKTGKLPHVFDQLADFYEELASREEELASALVYPAIVTVMMLGVIALSLMLVLPGYAEIFDASDMPLPFVTAQLISLSGFFAGNAAAVFFVFFAAAVLISVFLSSEPGKGLLARIKLKIPIFRQSINLSIAQSLSVLLSAGISISEAMPICMKVIDNPRVMAYLKELSASINDGMPFWISLEKIPFIDRLFVSMAQVGEEGGCLPQTMEKCSAYFSSGHKHSVRKLNKLIEPAITLVLGTMLAFVMLAVVLPTFELAALM